MWNFLWKFSIFFRVVNSLQQSSKFRGKYSILHLKYSNLLTKKSNSTRNIKFSPKIFTFSLKISIIFTKFYDLCLKSNIFSLKFQYENGLLLKKMHFEFKYVFQHTIFVFLIGVLICKSIRDTFLNKSLSFCGTISQLTNRDWFIDIKRKKIRINFCYKRNDILMWWPKYKRFEICAVHIVKVIESHLRFPHRHTTKWD